MLYQNGYLQQMLLIGVSVLKRIGRCLVFSFGAVVLMATVAVGQISKLDPGTLIEVLSDHGMSELLARLEGSGEAADDVTQRLIKIAQHRSQFLNPNVSAEDRRAAFDSAIFLQKQLIDEHRDHHQRAVWQTDLGRLLLIDYLGAIHQYAEVFYEFGVPKDEQREAFESVVVEALEHLADADLTFFRLSNTLPRQPDHMTDRVDTGLWSRMMDEYYRTRTQFLLAHAAYYTALLDNDHPYFKNLNNPNIPRQKKDPDQERTRLLELSVERLDPLVMDEKDHLGIRRASKCLMARVLSCHVDHPGLRDRAIEIFDQITIENEEDLLDLMSYLGKAVALERKNWPGEADHMLVDLLEHPLIEQDVLLRLVVVDQRHRLKLDRAHRQPPGASREKAVDEAYALYDELFSDPRLGEAAEGLKNYVYLRWESMAGDGVDSDSLPGTVLLAAGEIARLTGHGKAIEADQAEEAGDEQAAELLRAEAKPKLERAISICTKLLEKEAISQHVRANGMFNLGMARYLLGQGDTDLQIAAAGIWIDLAEQMSGERIAEEAIATAAELLRQFYSLEPKPSGVSEAYERASMVLFQKFPTSAAADNERYYFSYYVLSPQGRYAEAVEILGKTPKSHVLYFESCRELLHNLKKILDGAEKIADKKIAQKRLSETAERVIEEAKALPLNSDLQLVQDARLAHGMARLALADVALAQGNKAGALKYLNRFEDDFQGEVELIRLALSKGIVVQAQVGKFHELVTQAKKMMELFPDDAAGVIDEVLTDLTERIERLRREVQGSQVQREKDEKEQQAKIFANSAQTLAELLLDWAVRQKLSEEDLVPYQLLLARSMVMAGKADGAMDILGPLTAKYPGVQDLIHQTGEALFAMGDQDSLIKAAEQFDKLIGGLQAPFPPMWWNAWLRRLQIMDRLNESVADIPLRVRALEFTDKNLGGEPYRSQLKRLELKHTQ